MYKRIILALMTSLTLASTASMASAESWKLSWWQKDIQPKWKTEKSVFDGKLSCKTNAEQIILGKKSVHTAFNVGIANFHDESGNKDGRYWRKLKALTTPVTYRTIGQYHCERI